MGKIKVPAAIILLLAGIAVLFYPMVSNAVNRRSGSYAIAQWEQKLDSMGKDDMEAQRKEAEIFNDDLLEGIQPENYNSILNDGNGMIGYIRIPKIEVDLPVYHGVGEEVLAKGVGHLPESGFPIGREGDHPVLTGHTGLPSARMFTDLIKLREGDLFYIRILQQELCYVVDQIKVVLPTEGGDLAAVPGKDYCTLVTCTPYGVNSHRLLVRGIRTETNTREVPPGSTETKQKNKSGIVWLLLLLPVLPAGMAVKRLLDGGRKPPYNGKYLRKET